MKLSDIAWKQSLPLIQKIEKHPFNLQLAQGVLPKDIFSYYLVQDSIYLDSYIQAFAYIVAKIDKPYRETFCYYMHDMIKFEKKNIHEVFGVAEVVEENVKPTMATLAYTHFLLSTCSIGTAAVAVAAILPCFWIYAHLAKVLSALSISDNPYQRWIDTYNSGTFIEATQKAIDVFDQLALQASDIEKDKMLHAFYQAVCLEWHFWNDAYHKRSVDYCIF